jgi:hypothetical protein
VEVLHQLGGILVETSKKGDSENARTTYLQQGITQQKERRNMDQKGLHGTGSYQLTSPKRRWPATTATGAARLVRIAFKEKKWYRDERIVSKFENFTIVHKILI